MGPAAPHVVEYRAILLSPEASSWVSQRAALWNAAEAARRSHHSTVAREFAIALVSALSPVPPRERARHCAEERLTRHEFVEDVCRHKPGARRSAQPPCLHPLLDPAAGARWVQHPDARTPKAAFA
ncbi:MAG: MobA/MobL family protein [Steroidobacteraceae bacterium]